MAAALSSVETPTPPLRNGDHLTRDEFERRYDAMPDLKKAELIEGVVYLGGSVRATEGAARAALIGFLGLYSIHTPGVQGSASTHVRLDRDNMPQPNGLLMIEHLRGGQAIIDADGYLSGGPELFAEVVAPRGSAESDIKLAVSRRHGVREYVLWRVEQNALDWFRLIDGQYVLLPPGADGISRSEVFPGLWLDVAALLGGNYGQVLPVLQQGIASNEHQAFVARLQQTQVH